MGDNASVHKRQAYVMAGRVAEYADWTLVVWCGRCRDRTELRVQGLV